MIETKKLIEDLKQIAINLGHIPTSHQYQELGQFSSGLVKKRFLSWNNAIEQTFNVNRTKPVQEIACINCEKQTNNPKFCSKSCSSTYNNRIRKRKRKSFTCSYCGSVFTKRRKFCDDCSSQLIKTNKGYLPVSQATKADFLTKDTQRYRRIRDHARKIALAAGLLDECSICGYKKHVECSHSFSIASFSNSTLISVINHVDNLDGLCRNHHWEFENDCLD